MAASRLAADDDHGIPTWWCHREGERESPLLFAERSRGVWETHGVVGWLSGGCCALASWDPLCGGGAAAEEEKLD